MLNSKYIKLHIICLLSYFWAHLQKSMGLRKGHSKTMCKTSESRKKLQIVNDWGFIRDEPPSTLLVPKSA